MDDTYKDIKVHQIYDSHLTRKVSHKCLNDSK